MKIFMKILYGLAILTLGLIFFDSGKSARDDKYITDVILVEKNGNTLEGNTNDKFIGNMFSLNNLMYEKEKTGNITFNEQVLIGSKLQQVYINIDIYQVMDFAPSEKIKTNFNGIVNEFSIDGSLEHNLTIIGEYEKPIHYDSKITSYTVKNKNFPLFGLNDTIVSNEVNQLNSVTISYNTTSFFEIVMNKETTELETKYYFNDLENFPENKELMYDSITKILDHKVGTFSKPTLEQLIELNTLGYNYVTFTGQEKYNYIMYIYIALYLVIFVLSLYFIYLKPYFKNKNLRKRN